ncbi:MAG: hypothetical protein WCK12_00930 [Acidimicrobiaceae bacterium]|jgi:hypothetical protein
MSQTSETKVVKESVELLNDNDRKWLKETVEQYKDLLTFLHDN